MGLTTNDYMAAWLPTQVPNNTTGETNVGAMLVAWRANAGYQAQNVYQGSLQFSNQLNGLDVQRNTHINDVVHYFFKRAATGSFEG